MCTEKWPRTYISLYFSIITCVWLTHTHTSMWRHALSSSHRHTDCSLCFPLLFTRGYAHTREDIWLCTQSRTLVIVHTHQDTCTCISVWSFT